MLKRSCSALRGAHRALQPGPMRDAGDCSFMRRSAPIPSYPGSPRWRVYSSARRLRPRGHFRTGLQLEPHRDAPRPGVRRARIARKLLDHTAPERIGRHGPRQLEPPVRGHIQGECHLRDTALRPPVATTGLRRVPNRSRQHGHQRLLAARRCSAKHARPHNLPRQVNPPAEAARAPRGRILARRSPCLRRLSSTCHEGEHARKRADDV